jgi:uncharacterized membrane protein
MENQIIVTLPSRDLRAIAREALRGQWAQAFVVSIIFYLAISLPASLIMAIFPPTSPAQGLAGLYSLLVTGPFSYGYTLYVMSVFRKKNAETGQIFAGFENFGKTFVLMLLITIKVILWTLLFVIPGIIASFRYSQAFLILVDHPEYSASQCINESKKMMNGNKSKYFCLMLSFIGWYLLAGIPQGIVGAIEKNMGLMSTGMRVAFVLIATVASIGVIYLMPYVQAAGVAMYEIMAGNLKELTDEDDMISEPLSKEEPAEAKADTPDTGAAPTPEAEPNPAPEAQNPDVSVVEDVKVEWHKKD